MFIRLINSVIFFLALFWLPELACAQTKVRLEITSSLSPDPLPGRIINKLGIKDLAAVPADLLDQVIDNCLTAYENSGYPFARISLDSARYSDQIMEASLIIRTGELVRIDSVLNRTNFHISPRILCRILDLTPGDIYRENYLRKAGTRLSSLTFVKAKRPAEAGFHENKASLFVYPEKVPANRFDGWIGLSPGGNTGSGLSVAGAVELGLNNIFGQAESWYINWKRNQDRSQKMLIRSSFPYLAGLPFGLQNSFDLFRQDTIYLNLEWLSSIPYHFSPAHNLNLFFRYRQSFLLTEILSQQSGSQRPFTLWLTGVNWDLNTLDNRINPSRGVACRIEASTGSKKVSQEPEPFSQTEFQADFSLFYPVLKKLVLNARLQSGGRFSSIILENELFRLGGLDNLRGFNEDSFRAGRYFISTFELRYLLDNSSNLLVFADLAGIADRSDGSWQTRYPFGLGLGGQIRTAGGIFRIMFAMGGGTNQALNFGSTKIHLGYVGMF